MRFRIGRLLVYVHPLLPLAMMLMGNLGAAQGCITAFCCVLLHELGHLAAATALRAQALSLELMPLGGTLHIGGLYRLRGSHVIIIAISGPLISLAAALAGILFPQVFHFQFVLMNLLLCVFNMLPGMPMDGGRVLAALLRRKLGIRRSVRIAVQIGKCIGIMLIALAIVQAFSGCLNVPVLIMGVYLSACAAKEIQHCEALAAADVSKLLSTERFRHPLPVQALYCDAAIPSEEILRAFRPDRCTLLMRKDVTELETDLQWLQRHINT